MKNKQLLILVLVLAVLGAIVLLQNRRSQASWREGDGEVQTMLSASFDTDAIQAVTISGKDVSVRLEHKADGWKVADRFGYPANLALLKTFIADLTETRLAQSLELTSEQETELKLTDASGAVTANLLDKDNKALATFVFGKKHEKEAEGPKSMYSMDGNIPLGRFLRLQDKNYLVANTFGLVDEKITEWFDKDFFKVNDLRSATLSQDSKPVWTLSRDDKSATLSLLGEIPEGKEADTSRISSIKSAFSWIRFRDVADPAAKPADLSMENPKTLAIVDFDDFIYTIRFGTPKDDKQYMTVKVAWNGATTRTAPADEKPEDKAKLDAEFAQKVKENQDKAAELNARLSPWTYEVGAKTLEAVNHSFAELLKDKPAPKPEASTNK